ncbi:MAG: OB-fold nucleic acid binding domain-containing protein [Streptosporangiales bacterium]|nr:OB-fold nucleic acid binding domain-containing protein [Streptosporangiales bacterium]MBO0890582.1 OB-fold nucleic acid binding domain-containing protein [Acidothermales bacterium]
MSRDGSARAGLLGKVRRLFSSEEELEAEELQERTEQLGATPVKECADRSRATVAGTVRTVTLQPRAGSPALEAELYDGSDTLTLVWLGRRRIEGIEPGRRLRVQGLVSTNPDGARVMYNPKYELIASAAG